MFIGREKELQKLNKMNNKKGFQFLVMYGRRRVGKTTLLKEFLKDKSGIFFVAEEFNDTIALNKFSELILSHFKMSNLIDKFLSWEKAFNFIGEKSKDERIILIIDEFPYIANSNLSILSLLQNLIDQKLKNTNLFLILCGSSISFMEKEVLSEKSPLFGRRTGQMKINSFGFYDSIKFSKKYTKIDSVINYGILGGVPQYLNKFDYDLNIEGNIKENFLDSSSYLIEEPKNLLRQELREPAIYNSIIESVANGYTKISEIATKIQERPDKTSKYLNTLIELEIIEKEIPITEKINSRKSIYKLKDNMFKFYYRFIFTNFSLIEQGIIDFVYDKKIKPYLNQYTGFVFEDVCQQYLLRENYNIKLPFIFEKIGRWWGNNSIKKRQEEIDILAFNDKKAIFGECKWQDKKIGIEVYEQLLEKSNLLNFTEKYFYLFSKTGFTEEIIKVSKNNSKIKLITINEIL
ncbi:ATP-binding protein [Oceanotoga sp. DSM 15011]|uniref:ATP-binding protein n=1 Tax=Oceanotoga sp. DSM 15011 TaxID=2984951 RepID=UPI0021F4A2D7|nr:ATP-binding protein [Oceanotoga sp. DSM 15011]UYO99363.1 ATP-binding protein [Oceanotoga sp. DSM 15011]